MPFKPADAKKKTKKATTPKAKRQWAAIANRLLESGADEGSAITQANGVVKKRTAPPAAQDPEEQAETAPPRRKRPWSSQG